MRNIITAILILWGLSSFGQQKQLPDTITLKLTKQQILRIDSAIRTASDRLDSKAFTQYFQASFVELYNQVARQLVVVGDEKKPIKK